MQRWRGLYAGGAKVTLVFNIHTHTRMHACRHTCAHTHTHACTHTRTHTCTTRTHAQHAHTHTQAHIHTPTRMFMLTDTHMHTCMHTHMHTCMHTHTHAHTHTHTTTLFPIAPCFPIYATREMFKVPSTYRPGTFSILSETLSCTSRIPTKNGLKRCSTGTKIRKFFSD